MKNQKSKIKYQISKIKNIILFLVFIFIAGMAEGQDTQMSARVNKNTVVLGETLTLTVTVIGKATSVPEPTMPNMPDLDIKSSGRSQSISFVNGQVSSSISFTYIVLPKSLGKHTIQPITLPIGGRIYETPPILIEVVQSRKPAPGKVGIPSPGVRKEKLPKSDTAKNIFVKASLDKKEVYVGEMVTYIFKFYQRIRLLGNAEYIPPDLVGFLKKDLPPQKTYYAEVGTSRYRVSEIRTALFPTSSGTVTIGPASIKAPVPAETRDPFADDDFFRSIFGSRAQTKFLKTNSITLKILPLPDKSKPAGFGGAMGTFTISSTLDTKELKVGEPVTWSITIAGEGNIKSITEPVWREISGFKKYDTVSSLNSKVENYRIKGSKVFQVILVPEVSGTQTIQSATFSFFDTTKRTYRTIQSKPITVTVAPGKKKDFFSVVSPQDTGIKMLDRDIRFIKISGMHRVNSAKPLIIRAGYWGAALGILFLVIACFIVEKYRTRVLQDVGWARSRAAHRVARKRVSHASQFLKQGNDKEFFTAISDAVTGFLADKMNIAAAGLTMRDVIEQLSSRKVDTEFLNRIKNVLEQCDFGRFTSSLVSQDIKRGLLKDTREIIALLGKVFKK